MKRDNFLFNCFILFVCCAVRVCVCNLCVSISTLIPWHSCGGQKTIFGILFALSTVGMGGRIQVIRPKY